MLLRIKAFRKERGLTVEQLAAILGMSKSYVSELENGRKQINGRRLEAFAKALGVQTTELIADPQISDELATHVSVVRDLDPADQQAVYRHALGLLRAKQK